jgi:hypothetical protein
MIHNFYLHFDVESIGLHGEGFAVGVCVVNSFGETVETRVFACSPSAAKGETQDRKWVEENVPVLEYNESSPLGVRNAFWDYWGYWRRSGGVLVADCAWPVETRFLSDCVTDDLDNRRYEGPYPLFDLSTLLLANGMNAHTNYTRHDDEMPPHHPLMDARQSARIFTALMQGNLQDVELAPLVP